MGFFDDLGDAISGAANKAVDTVKDAGTTVIHGVCFPTLPHNLINQSGAG